MVLRSSTGLRIELDCDYETSHIMQEEMEIMYILSGRIGIFSKEYNCLLKEEDIVVFNPMELHELYREEGYHTLSFFVPFSLIRNYKVPAVMCCSVLQPRKNEYICFIRKHLAILYKSMEGKEQPLFVMSELLLILNMLSTQFKGQTDANQKYIHVQEDEMRPVLLYLLENYGDNEISLSKTAEHFYLAPSTLSRKFKQVTGKSFSEYLRTVRIRKAEKLLSEGTDSVLEISERCGFASVNTMIRIFRDFHGVTPLAYRNQRNFQKKQNLPKSKLSEGEEMLLLSFLKFAMAEDGLLQVSSEVTVEKNVSVDPTSFIRDRGTGPDKVCVCGYAVELLDQEICDQLKKFSEQVPFSYYYVQGIFDDSLGVYHKSQSELRQYNWQALDVVLDHILQLGCPWLEFSRIPEDLLDNPSYLYENEYIQLPDDYGRWKQLVNNFLQHIISRYGYKKVAKWRFSVSPTTGIFYGIYSKTDYFRYYFDTMTTVREIIPDAFVSSGAFDMDLLSVDYLTLLDSFMDYCDQNTCRPDGILLQEFCRDYSSRPRKEVENLLRFKEKNIRYDEPAPPSISSDIVCENLRMIHKELAKKGWEDIPLYLVYFAHTNWPKDLGSDTCFYSSFLVKNYCENERNIKAVGAWLRDGQKLSNEFHGDIGLVGAHGVPKAGYFALLLYNLLEMEVLAETEGYMITANHDRTRYAIIFYYYCHYNHSAHLTTMLPLAEQQVIDRYSAFETSGNAFYTVTLREMGIQPLRKETFILNRGNGSSYDNWRKMGAPLNMDENQLSYLNSVSQPGYSCDTITPSVDGSLVIPVVLDIMEIRLIRISKI